MFDSCATCAKRRKEKVFQRTDSRGNVEIFEIGYGYECGRSGYVMGVIDTDSELKNMGCSDWCSEINADDEMGGLFAL